MSDRWGPLYNDEELTLAQGVVYQLLRRDYRSVGHDRMPPLVDVVTNFIRFLDQIPWLEEHGRGIPFLGGIPVDLRLSEHFFDRDRTLERLEENASAIAFLSLGEARDILHELASEFIATRMAGIRWYREGPRRDRHHYTTWTTMEVVGSFRDRKGHFRQQQTTTPGCNCEVRTRQADLRVHWSGAYFLSPNLFGAPTSPVSNVLQSGVYIFGVDGGTYRDIVWDVTKVVLPGASRIELNW
jgi:hypothetical protein